MKTIAYWEGLVLRVRKQLTVLQDLERRHESQPRPNLYALTRRRRAARYLRWQKQLGAYQAIEQRRRRLGAQLRFYEERIEALRSLTGWDRIRRCPSF